MRIWQFSRLWQLRLLTVVALSGISCAALVATAKEPITPMSGPINLLEDGLDKFYTWSRGIQYEDPLRVYTYQDGVLQISGETWGGLTTKEEYADYHMVFEYRWGDRTWANRKDRARDSGILVHCIGPDGGFNGTWMASIEAQIIEGGTGDILVLSAKHKDGSPIVVSLAAEVAKDRDGETVWKKGGEKKTLSSGRINWFGRDPDWEDKIGFRGQDDVASPHGEWTRYDVVCEGGKITTIVNGVVVNHGFDADPKAGKILVQSEGAEIFVRRWELWPLGKAPASPE
ncbi:MAG: DUF1080 domain-containing protein [Planctomycetes bacterium]|nr:DUF1080 domain-containing protein [Planctomycetota bacterium]